MKKILSILLPGLFFITTFSLDAQRNKVTLNLNHTRIKDVFSEIEKQTDYLFFYSKSKINPKQIISIVVQNKPVTEVLDELFKGTNIRFSVIQNHIVVTNDSEQNPEQQDLQSQKKKIQGYCEESGRRTPDWCKYPD